MTKNEKIMAGVMFRSLENTSATNIRNTFKFTALDDVVTITPFIKDHIMELTEKNGGHGGYYDSSFVQAYIDVMDKKAPLFTPDEFIKIISTFNYDWTYIGRLARVTTKMPPDFYMDHSELLSPYYKGLSRIHPEIKSDSNQLLYELGHMENFDITKVKNYSLGKEMQSCTIDAFKDNIKKFSICKMMQKSNIEFLKKHHDYVEVLLTDGGSNCDNYQFIKKCIEKLDVGTFKQIITADEMFEYIRDSVVEADSIYENSGFRGYRFDVNTYSGKSRLQAIREKNLQDYIPFSENEKKNFYNNINAMFDAYEYLGHKINYYEIPGCLDKEMEGYPKLLVEAGYVGSVTSVMRKAEEAFAKAILEKDYSAEIIAASRKFVK